MRSFSLAPLEVRPNSRIAIAQHARPFFIRPRGYFWRRLLWEHPKVPVIGQRNTGAFQRNHKFYAGCLIDAWPVDRQFLQCGNVAMPNARELLALFEECLAIVR